MPQPIPTSTATRMAKALWLLGKAEKWAARIGLLRTVAWFSGAGLALTLGEIAYGLGNEIYLYFQPTALQEWMKRSVFRNPSDKGAPFDSSHNELVELGKARQLTGLPR